MKGISSIAQCYFISFIIIQLFHPKQGRVLLIVREYEENNIKNIKRARIKKIKDLNLVSNKSEEISNYNCSGFFL